MHYFIWNNDDILYMVQLQLSFIITGFWSLVSAFPCGLNTSIYSVYILYISWFTNSIEMFPICDWSCLLSDLTWCINIFPISISFFSLLIQSGAATNAQDLDGWTPLHAAAHWAQREACELLCENYANMDIKNYVGQTCFDVADPDVIRLLEELKKKQNTLQKDRPEIRNLINRPAIPAGTSPANTGKRR